MVTVILHVLEAQPFGREGGADHAAAAQLALRRAQVACGRAVGRDRVSRRLGEERDQYLVGVRLRDRIRDRVRDRVRVRLPRRRARPVPSREARAPCRP